MQTYDIVHNGWALNDYPIHEIDLTDKLAKWERYFKPLEVVPSEASYTRESRHGARTIDRVRQRAIRG